MTRILVAFAAFALPLSAFAATETSNMAVSVDITNSCTISAGALAFGSYDPVAGTQVDGTADLTVACTEGSTNGITLGQGANADSGSSDAAPLRRMTDGSSNFLSYALFSDSGRSTVWGNTVGTDVDYVAADSSSATVTVYGRIAAAQSAPAGTYTDTVVATIEF
jgi:spore coat protein U-like protein